MLNATEAKQELATRLVEIEAEEMVAKQMRVLKYAARTIDFCENVVSERIQNAIKQGKDWVSIWLGFPNDEDACGEIKLEKKGAYANGDDSYTETTPYYHLGTMKEYLTVHGYRVSTHTHNYSEFGLGHRKGISLQIEW